MGVYFARRDYDGLIKIGWSRRVPGRLKDLGLDESALLGVLNEGGGHRMFGMERDCHKVFAAERSGIGEWFRFSPELEAVLARRPNGQMPTSRQILARVLAEARRRGIETAAGARRAAEAERRAGGRAFRRLVAKAKAGDAEALRRVRHWRSCWRAHLSRLAPEVDSMRASMAATEFAEDPLTEAENERIEIDTTLRAGSEEFRQS